MLSAIVVTGTGDTVDVDGVVTLREALESMNGGLNINADVTAVGVYGVNDAIQFNIPGAGVQTISPASPLPTITTAVAIEGYSQPGTSVNTSPNSNNAVLLIELDGSNAGLGASGLVLGVTSDGASVTGLVINRFSGTQVLVQSSDATTITGNFIGTDATGNVAASGTSGTGIGSESSLGVTIGGIVPAAKNVIGGNSDGINLSLNTQETVIQGNLIGVGADGTTAVGNRLQGVAINGSQYNTIGGVILGAGNSIVNNGAAGVAVFDIALPSVSSTGNTILGNSIYRNGLNDPGAIVGIDLVATNVYPALDGATANDLGDSDEGPNVLINTPVLTAVTSDDLSTTIVGTLNSSRNTSFRIEFFASVTSSGTGFGEGESYLGFVDVMTDEFGDASFSTTVAVAVPNGQFVTATATGAGTATGNPQLGGAAILGAAADFAVLAGSTVTITGPTHLIGNVGVSPGSVIAGSFTTTGTVHIADPVASNAQLALTTAFNALAAMPFTTDLTGQELGGMTLTPGIYNFDTSAQLTGPLPLILDTLGDPHALFVFQIGSTLTTAASVGSAVIVVGGPADNVFWQVGSSATIGVGTAFVGNILADQSITLETGATLANGRALARIGAVTLDTIQVDSTTLLPIQNSTSEFSATSQVAIPGVSINDVSVVEGNAGTTDAVFTVTLSAPSSQTVTVQVSSLDGTATPSLDYLSLPLTTLTFLPGETSKTVTVTVNGDSLFEADENFTINLASVVNATIVDGQGLGTILNDDAVPTLSISDVTLLEVDAGTSDAVFTITLSAASGQAVSVTASTLDGSAVFPSDYISLLPMTVIFAPGETSKTITVAVNGDALSETNETFFVDLTLPINATIADGQGLGTIIDDDVAPTLSIGDVTLVEGDAGVTNAVFTVTLSAASGQVVTVSATTSDGTAASPLDYIGVPTVLTFAPGETTQTVTVAVNGDTVAEPDETFFVDLTLPTNATIVDVQGLGTITDDDAAPTLSIGDVTLVEGDAGVTNAVFTVTLSAASGQVVTVSATTSDGTAASPLDYVGVPTVLTFAPGETTQTLTVAVNGDTLSESDETFFVDLTLPTNATIVDAQGLGTITDDDVAPTLSIGDVTLVEGDAGVTNAVFTVTLSAASGQVVTVTATAADGTAASPLDYVGVPTVLTFAPGETTQTVTVAVNGDTLTEPNETFFVDLTLPTNAAIVDAQGLGTIINDDIAPTLSIGDVTLVEGNAGVTNAVFTVTLSAASSQVVTVTATTSDGTASSPLDFVGVPIVLTFAPGETTQTVTVAVNGDTLSEPDETFFVDLTLPTNATIIDAQGLGTITDDDVAPTISIGDVTLIEGDAGVTNAVFTVTLSAASSQIVTVSATTSDGTAASPLDYVGVPTVLTFTPGETTKTVTVAVIGDAFSELDETFFVDLTLPTNATIVDAQGLGTITDDDAAPTVSIGDVTLVEGNGGVTNAVFTVTLSAASGQVVTVTATTSNGTAASPLDYVGVPTVLTFAPGETTQTVTVAVNGDTLSEPDETFFVDLTLPTNATIADAQGLGTITNDDLVPTLSIGDVTLVEGDAGVTNAVFTITLSAASSQVVTVTATTSDGTASSPLDYVGVPIVLTFAPGETTQTVTVAVNGDTVSEPDETFFVDLTLPTNATILDAQGLGTITDDDAAPTLSIGDVTLVEGNAGVTNAVFTVTLSAASSQVVTVTATTSDGTAASPLDYVGVPIVLTFAPGETTQTVTVAVNGDTVSEPDETFFVNLTLPTNATIVDAQGLGTITNDDSTTNVSIVKITDGSESATPVPGQFQIIQSAISLVDTVVQYSVNGTATPGIGNDYTQLSGFATIPAGQLSVNIAVDVLNDSNIEDTESVIVTLTGFVTQGPGVVLSSTAADLTATVTITDDEQLLITSPATASVAENTSAATVVLDVNATPVAGRTFVYSLSGPDAALFQIDPATGEIRFLASPDFEVPGDQGANNVYDVTVNITTDFTPERTTSQAVSITVTPVNDNAPIFVDASPTLTITENSSIGTSVGTVLATDADQPGDVLTYSIASGNESGAFAIDAATGQITVADPTLLDFESGATFTLQVQATDNGSPTALTANAVVIVNVTDAEEGPTIMFPRANGIFHMGRIPAFVSPDSTFTYDDVADPDYSNAKLTASIVVNRDSKDRINIFPKGEGQNRINTKGRKLYYSDQLIGTFKGGYGKRNPDFVVTFNSNATTEAVDNLMRRLNYHSKRNIGVTRTVTVQVTNIGGVDSNVEARDIAVIDIR